MGIHFYKFVHKVSTNRWLVSIKKGLIKIQPLILIVCLLQIILYMLTIIGNDTAYVSRGIVIFINLIYDIIRYMTVVTISYYLAEKSYKERKDIEPIIVSGITLASITILYMGNDTQIGIRLFNILDSLTIIIFTAVSTELFLYLYKHQRGYLKNRINSYDKITSSFNYVILPAVISGLICVIIKYIFIDNLLVGVIMKNMGGSNNSIFKEVLSGQILWFLGGHGGNVIYNNSPYLAIITLANLGGAGSTLALMISVYILNCHKEKASISKIPIVATIFNINEPILYGIPIIFNPIYLIPFILVPVVSAYIILFASNVGFIRFTDNNLSWVMPVFINGYILTGSLKGVFVQGINLTVGILIYMPFVKLSNKINEIEIRNSFEKLKKIVFSNKVGEIKLIDRDDDIGDIARSLAGDLYHDLSNKNGLYLEYQPQISKKDLVVGVEALLRWKHRILGNIPPNIVILLAIELEIINDLGKWIINESCKELSRFKKEFNKDIEISINVASHQLSDRKLCDYIVRVVDEYNVNFNNIKIEITETVPLGNDEVTKEQIKKLNDLGIKFAIDDFGQGYNPILYLKKYNIDTVKLDGALIKDIDKNHESRYIVRSMFDLCDKLGMNIVCEFVENEKQKLILDDMGEGIYQGYLFSRPLGENEIIDFIKKNFGV